MKHWKVFGINRRGQNTWLCIIQADTLETAEKRAYNIYGRDYVTKVEGIEK